MKKAFLYFLTIFFFILVFFGFRLNETKAALPPTDEKSPFGKHFIGYWEINQKKKEKIYQAYKETGVKWIRWGVHLKNNH